MGHFLCSLSSSKKNYLHLLKIYFAFISLYSLCAQFNSDLEHTVLLQIKPQKNINDQALKGGA